MISYPFIQPLQLCCKKRKEEKKYHLQMSCVFRGHVSITGCHVCLVRNLANKGFAVVGTNILSLSNEEFHRDKWGRGNEIWANPCAISSVSFDRGLRIEPGGDLHQYPRGEFFHGMLHHSLSGILLSLSHALTPNSQHHTFCRPFFPSLDIP